MGKLINGIFGGFHGRIGNLVGYTLKGKYVIRKIGKSTKPLTPGRRANCQKMTMVNEILSPSLQAIQVGYRHVVAGTDKNEYNEAVSYNKKNALQGTYPNISLDYSKVLLSMGTLAGAVNPTVSQADDKITFNWKLPTHLERMSDDDRAMLVVYFPDLKVSCCHLIGSKRIEGSYTLTIGPDHVNEHMEAYISFVKDNGREVSNSAYAGALNASKIIKTLEKADPEQEHANGGFNYSGSDFDIITYREYLLISGTNLMLATKEDPNKITPGTWVKHVLKNTSSGQVIGDCSFKLNRNDKCAAEMKVNIFTAFQRHGYAKEAASAMVSFLFQKAEVNRIVKILNAQDEAAIALLKSLGFKEEAHFPESVFSDGKWMSETQFTILKSDWV